MTYKLFFLSYVLNTKELPSAECIEETENEEILKLWHRRMEHFNIASIKDRLPKINLKGKWPICVESKIKNFPYDLSENKTKEPFEMIYMDTVLNSDEPI